MFMTDSSLKHTIKLFISSSWGNLVLSALVGALVSLATTTYLDNKNREINLKPYLNFGIKALDSDHTKYGVVIRNLGKGPAIIDKIALKFNDVIYNIDKNYDRDFRKDFLAYSKMDKSCYPFLSSEYLPGPGDSIFENTEIGLITIPKSIQYTDHNSESNLRILERHSMYSGSVDEKRYGRAAVYLFDKFYEKCSKSFYEFFASDKNSFKISIEYRSLNDSQVYGIGEFYPVKLSKLDHGQINDLLKDEFSSLKRKIESKSLNSNDQMLLNDLGILK